MMGLLATAQRAPLVPPKLTGNTSKTVIGLAVKGSSATEGVKH